jgi:HD-GYP domain-containing protein (c-di-GMP phosphodiesterase class II)
MTTRLDVDDLTWLEPIHQQWVATLDAIRDAVLVLDAENRVVRVNKAFAELCKASYDQLLGEHISSLCPWLVTDGGDVACAIARAADDRLYRVRNTSVGPNLVGTVVILEDVTEEFALEEVERTYREGSYQAFLETLESLLRALGAQDPYTVMHCQRVADLSKKIAMRLGVSDLEAQAIYHAARVHDLGKITVPSSILHKPGKPVQAEMNLIRLHPEAGVAVVKELSFPWPVHEVILQHHERLDGTGYPAGVRGEEISFAVRVVTVADVVEAMATHRPYRPALGIAPALSEITAGKGIRYDSTVVEACVDVLGDPRVVLDITS